MFALFPQPRQRHLCGCGCVAVYNVVSGHGAQLRDHHLVSVKVLVVAGLVRQNRGLNFLFCQSSREKTPTQRRVRHETDTQFACCGHHMVFHVPRPHAPFTLHRSDGMDRHGGAQFGGRDLRKPQVADFSFLHQLRHGLHRLFNRAAQVWAVHVVEVNGVHAQATQRLLTALPNILTITPHPRLWVVGQPRDPELGGQLHLVPSRRENPAH